jgi:hypothetical protein
MSKVKEQLFPAQPKKDGKTVYPEKFEQFFKSYPSRRDESGKLMPHPKKPAYTAWKRVIKDVPPEKLLVSLTGFFADLESRSLLNTPYICHPATYLNQERYEAFLDYGQPEKPKKPPYQPPVDNAKKMQLYRALGESDYRLWLDPCWIFGDELHVSSQLRADWIKEKFDGLLWKNGIKKVRSKGL